MFAREKPAISRPGRDSRGRRSVVVPAPVLVAIHGVPPLVANEPSQHPHCTRLMAHEVEGPLREGTKRRWGGGSLHLDSHDHGGSFGISWFAMDPLPQGACQWQRYVGKIKNAKTSAFFRWPPRSEPWRGALEGLFSGDFVLIPAYQRWRGSRGRPRRTGLPE